MLLAFYEHIHLDPNQSLRYLLCFSSKSKDLIRAYPWIKKTQIKDQWLGKYYYILGRIWSKRGISEQVSDVVKLGTSTTTRKHLSNNINETIRDNFRPFFTKRFYTQKKHKKHKTQTSDFHSDVFIRTENIKKQTSNFHS